MSKWIKFISFQDYKENFGHNLDLMGHFLPQNVSPFSFSSLWNLLVYFSFNCRLQLHGKFEVLTTFVFGKNTCLIAIESGIRGKCAVEIFSRFTYTLPGCHTMVLLLSIICGSIVVSLINCHYVIHMGITIS